MNSIELPSYLCRCRKILVDWIPYVFQQWVEWKLNRLFPSKTFRVAAANLRVALVYVCYNRLLCWRSLLNNIIITIPNRKWNCLLCWVIPLHANEKKSTMPWESQYPPFSLVEHNHGSFWLQLKASSDDYCISCVHHDCDCHQVSLHSGIMEFVDRFMVGPIFNLSTELIPLILVSLSDFVLHSKVSYEL